MKNNIVWRLALAMFAFVACLALPACSDDDDDEGGSSSGLVGNWYAMELPSKGSSDYSGKAYYFKNSNTVYYYNTISGSPRWDYSERLTGPMSGWYIQEDCYETYTYEIIDNKVYIPMKGTILTISGNSLKVEGSSSTFKKM